MAGFVVISIYIQINGQIMESYQLGLERMSELSRVHEPWLKFGHEYSPYQSSDGSQISY